MARGSATQDGPRMSPEVSPVDAARALTMEEEVAAAKKRLYVETWAKEEIKEDMDSHKRIAREARQAKRDSKEADLDAQRREERLQKFQAMVRSMSDRDFKAYEERNKNGGYVPEELAQAIEERRRMGSPHANRKGQNQLLVTRGVNDSMSPPISGEDSNQDFLSMENAASEG